MVNPPPPTKPLTLNGFSLEFSAPAFTVRVEELPDPANVRSRRTDLQEEWFVHWRGGQLFLLPKVKDPSSRPGQEVQLQCQDHEALHLLASRINDVIPRTFPKYRAFRQRPFSFLGQRDEFVAAIVAGWANMPSLLTHFQIRPRFELDPRLVELRDGEPAVGLFLAVDTRWEITAPLDELLAARVDVAGLHVVRRQTEPGQRRLVGRIGTVRNGIVELAETYGSDPTIPASSVYLEGSRSSFSRCLKTILGSRFENFEDGRYAQEERFFTGPALDQLLRKMGAILHKASPLSLAPDLQCTIGDRIELCNSQAYTTFHRSSPIEYCFDPAKSKRTPYAWTGLEKYGPYSRDTFPAKTPRILVVCPDSVEGQVDQFLRKLRDGITTHNRSSYASGLARTFHLVNPRFETCAVSIPTVGSPATAYRQRIQDFVASRGGDFQAAIVTILDQHAHLPDEDNPYLWARATLLLEGIPAQQARLSTIIARDYELQYSLQNIAIALYAKMGGVPWTVDHPLTVNDELVIGIGNAELSGSRFETRQRHIGITTVFRGDGNYLLSNISQECSFDEYPNVLEDSTARVLREVKTRNGWQPGDTVRIVFHAFKPLKNVEVARIVNRCACEVGKDQTVQFAFLTVSHDHSFKLLDLAQEGLSPRGGRGKKKAIYVPARGLIVQLGRFTRLVCANGPTLIKRAGSPLPSPLLVHLHHESDYRDQTYLAEQVLKFTSLSWRSTLPARRPVTIYYSSLIAEALARLRSVPDWSPSVLNGKLRASKWFL